MDAGSSNSTAPGPLLSADYTNYKTVDCANAFCVDFGTPIQ